MKTVKRALALVLALTLLLAMSATVFAAAQTYSITVKNENESISIKDNTYYAYRIFDATYNGDNVAYTVNKNFTGFTYTVSDESYQGEALINYLAGLTADSAALDAFAKAALDYATTNHISAAGTVKATDETAVISVDAPGYYLVAGTATAPNNQIVTAACSLTTAKPDAEVNIKADVPSIDKKIVEESSKVEANTANIGDKVSYEITSKVPNMKGYTQYFFVMNDTLSKGLTYNGDMVIKVGEKTLDATNGYTLTTTNNNDGSTTLEIVFKNFIQYKTGDAITVTYSATLNQGASLDPTAGNPNEVKLIYSNNPNVEGKGEPDNPDKPGKGDATGETPKAETKTYVTGIKLTKVDGKNTNTTLTGAKFKIEGTGMKVVLVNEEMYKESAKGTYYMLKDGTYTTTVPVTDKKNAGYNADRYDDTSKKYEKVDVVTKDTALTEINATGYVDANGVLTFEGLGAGSYTITELVAPNGYNLLKESIKVNITAEAALDKCTWIVTAGSNIVTADGNLYAFQVENNAGAELPSTGGIGTTVFYVLGGLLVVCAGVLLITKRRMNKNA